MNRTFFAIGLIAVALLVAPIGAVAQETATTTTGANATTETTQTTTTGGASSGTQNVSIQLSEDTDKTVITQWRFEDGSFYVTIRAKLPTSIKITDSGRLAEALNEGDGSKATTIPTEGYTLTSGTTTIEFDAVEVDGESAITVASADGAVLLRTGSMETGSKPAVSWQTVQLLLLGAVGMTAGITFSVVRRKAEDEDKEAERIL